MSEYKIAYANAIISRQGSLFAFMSSRNPILQIMLPVCGKNLWSVVLEKSHNIHADEWKMGRYCGPVQDNDEKGVSPKP